VHAGILRSQFGETFGGALPHPRLCLRERLERGKALQERRAGLSVHPFSNPTVTMFEQRMTALERGAGRRVRPRRDGAFTTALMGQVRSGDHIVSSKAVFGSCLYVVEEQPAALRRRLDPGRRHDLDQWRKSPCAEQKTFFLETPTNPALEYSTSKRSPRSPMRWARRWSSTTCSHMTPLFQRRSSSGPIAWSIPPPNIFDGQGRCLGGVILASEKFIQRPHRDL